MKRAALAALLSCAAFAQSQPPRAFDISSVQASPRATWAKTPVNALQGGYLTGDRYELRRATMLDLIHAAYDLDPAHIYGGPTWLDYDKFDVSAKTAPGTRPDALRQMLQALLADRFKLTVKPETQELPAYVLTVAKDQSKLKPAESPGGEGCQNVPATPGPGGPPMATIRCRGVTMDQFISALRRLAPAFFENLPAVNSTSLEGAWDMDLKYPPRGFRIDPSGETTVMNANGLFDALDKQLGLKLELGKAPQAVLTVESVNEQPAPDPPGVAAALPPLPAPEFEVASLRPCDSDGARLAPLRVEPGGRVTGCMPLSTLFYQAFNTNAQQRPVGLPKALEDTGLSNRISIVAKAPAGVFPAFADAAQTRETLNVMLRALLVDRYKIAYHYEDRPVDAFTLAAAKPKMTKADPSQRTGCTRQNDAGPSLDKIVCKNITMAQFAEQVLAFYPAARYPVLDGTHLDGAWDFTLEFNPVAGLMRQMQAEVRARAATEAGAPQPAADAASEPPSGPTNLAEAIEKQIGLKLESHKRSEPVLVIDHMDEKPSDN